MFLLQEVKGSVEGLSLALVIVLDGEYAEFFVKRFRHPEVQMRDFALVEIPNGLRGRWRITLAAGRWDVGHYAAFSS